MLFYENPNGKLYHGDCLKIMKDIPDGSVDMALCDLPYGMTACDWDVVIPFGRYGSNTIEYAKRMHRFFYLPHSCLQQT